MRERERNESISYPSQLTIMGKSYYSDSFDIVVRFIIVLVLTIFCIFGSNVVYNRNTKYIKRVNKHLVVELEDGHWYMRCNGNLIHYVECPKCNN